MLRSTLSSLRDWREYLTPVSHVSNFKTTGQVTPEEFITAGDYLVYKFPTWSWASAPPSKRRDFLPSDKQYLVTKHVPSYVRSSNFEAYEDTTEVDEEGWVSTDVKKNATCCNPSKADSSGGDENTRDQSHAQAAQAEEILDIEDELDEEEDGDVYRQTQTNTNTLTPTRTYNLFITYSTSYRVPKFYLSGFNADGNPLTPSEMFEDIIGDYKDKTVTIERAPFEEDLTLISIHPCRHANVMRILLDKADERLRNKLDAEEIDVSQKLANVGLAESSSHEEEADDWEQIATNESPEEAIRVDQYLVIFLKFIASVTPGIEHDYTMSAL